MTRYERLACELRSRIEEGYYRAGERLPSVRDLVKAHQVSIATVQHAYQLLESDGLIEARQRSGHFVRPRRQRPPPPSIGRVIQRPVEVSQWEQVREGTCLLPDAQTVYLGRGMPDIDTPTLRPLLRALSRYARRQSLATLNYDSLQGMRALREQIARLALGAESHLHPDELVITTGCHEAISIAMRAVAEPGAIIAVDSPSFYGSLQAIRSYGMKVMEIPTDPSRGISLEALELALEQWPIRAIQVTPSCNNPLGYNMPLEHRRALYALAQRFDVMIIEDDVYGDLEYAFPRQPTIKSLDGDGRVLLCGSFSKTLAPGLRIGWIAPGRHLERALHLKYVGTGSTATHAQLALAEFIGEGHYDPHLRRMRAQYLRNRDAMLDAVATHFPAATCATRPQGSFLLWLECAPELDSVALNQRLAKQRVRIAPGPMFSAVGKHRHCLRINYSTFNPQVEAALASVGAEAARMLEEAGQAPATRPIDSAATVQ